TAPAGAPPAPFVPTPTTQTSYLGLSDIHAFDTSGKELKTKELSRLLKKEVLALVYHRGQKVDPLHLRLLKEGTLVFLLPLPASTSADANGMMMPVPALPGGNFVPPPAVAPAAPAAGGAIPAPPVRRDPA